MQTFTINGQRWFVEYIDPKSDKLKRSDGSRTIGMTDGKTHVIYISNRIFGRLLDKVLCHELVHCICFSYNITLDILEEEYLANWVSMYGREVVVLLDNLLSNTYNSGII